MPKRPQILGKSRARNYAQLHTRAARTPQTASDLTADPAQAVAELYSKLSTLEVKLASLKEENERLLNQLPETGSGRDAAQFSDIFRQMPAPMLVLNDYGTILQCNPAASRLLQLKRGKTAPNFFGRFVQRNDVGLFLRLLRDCKLKGAAVSVLLELRTERGEILPGLVTAAPLLTTHRRKIENFCIIISDETRHVRSEQKILELQKADHDFLDSIGAILWEADAETLRRTYVSKQLERFLGYPVEQWLRQPDLWQNRIAVEDRDRVIATTLQAVAARRNYICEYRLYTADRMLIWVRDAVNVLTESPRLKLRGITIDITDNKKTHEELQRAHETLEERVRERTAELEAAVKELEAFSYTLSHDMRAPLRSMHGYAELAIELCGEQIPPHAHEYLKRIQTSAQRLDSMIQDVLKYTKVSKSPIQLQPIELEPLIQRIIQEYPTFQNGRADIKIEAPLLPVMGHEGFLAQCVGNLLANAIKFVKPKTKPRVHIYTRPQGKLVQLFFQDNGIGIEPKDQWRIFRIFQRLHPEKHYEGTGLGLAIVQRAAERMGGKVGVESTPRHGSKFWIELRKAA